MHGGWYGGWHGGWHGGLVAVAHMQGRTRSHLPSNERNGGIANSTRLGFHGNSWTGGGG